MKSWCIAAMAAAGWLALAETSDASVYLAYNGGGAVEDIDFVTGLADVDVEYTDGTILLDIVWDGTDSIVPFGGFALTIADALGIDSLTLSASVSSVFASAVAGGLDFLVLPGTVAGILATVSVA